MLTRQSRILARSILIGAYFQRKYRAQVASGSVTKSAKNLRKLGVPVEMAVLLLAY